MNPLFEKMTTDYAAEVLRGLVRIDSISKNEGELAAYLMEKCRALGMEAEIDRHGNMLAHKKYSGDGMKFALNTHMDTVDIGDAWTEEPFGCRMDGTVMYGLGALDTKASMAGMLMALEALSDGSVPLKGELWFTAVVQEEVQGEHNKGTVKMIQDGFTADMVLIGEPTKLQICRGCEGMTEVTIQTTGVPTHASNAEEGVNAIDHMVRIIQEIHRLRPGQSDLLGSGSINVGVIQGGNRSSVVPDSCTLKVSRFVVEGETGRQFCDQIQEIIDRLKRADPALSATAELTYASLAGVVEESTPLVGYLKAATAKALGVEASVTGMRAHLDSDFLINMAGIPSVAFGPGDITLAHRADEWVDVREAALAAKVYLQTILEAMGA